MIFFTLLNISFDNLVILPDFSCDLLGNLRASTLVNPPLGFIPIF
ncbi:BnaA02g25800D [Brassica napus]|uniref:BnaA02g25800D protein n=1 Tax=Brassica napus TaxID=3708 RepID=A0A078F4M8_BRANA|nr:BnaA02g25800D [Brassica napus]